MTTSRTGSIIAFLSFLALVLAYALAPPPAQADGTWTWPVTGEVVTPYLNGDDPYAAGQHRGIDIGAPAGAPVVAATAGTVTFAGTVGSAGLTVGIRTDDGRFDTSYLHLESAAVEEGDQVEPGDPVGAVGTSGIGSTDEPHLHFGVRDAGEDHAYHDPLDFLGAPGTAAPNEPPAPIVPPLGPVPAPEPGPAPAAPSPAPVRAPAPKGQPVARPAPAPSPAPQSLPRPALRPVPAPLPRRGERPRSAPDPARSPVPHPSHAPQRADAPSAATEPGPVPVPSPGPGAVDPRHARHPGSAGGVQAPARTDAPAVPAGGPDVGWVLALVGLALAGAAMLRPVGARTLARRASEAIGAIRHPSWGRS